MPKKSLRPELLLPAGSPDTLRAAVNNGADAIYLGLDRFNARKNAKNFTRKNISSYIDYAHKRGVKVYIAFNTLIKNDEIRDYFEYISAATGAGADAIIIQDPAFIPHIKKNFPKLRIHLSTQAFTTNNSSIPENIDRVVLPREMPLKDIEEISMTYETEIFVHGALCFSMSGQCLFSSMVGGRSANRGLCAQPCRMRYNNKYLLSTKDLCLLEKLPEIIATGTTSLKIEGRMRSPNYVATAARIYSKYINLCLKDPKNYHVRKEDLDDLKLAFSREFTQGFAFEDNITDTRAGTNRGLFLGRMKDNKIMLKSSLGVGDGIAVWENGKTENKYGLVVENIIKDKKKTKIAKEGDIISIANLNAPDYAAIYKTSKADKKVNLGPDVKINAKTYPSKKLTLPEFSETKNNDQIRIFAKAYTKKDALELDKSGADIIYLSTDIPKEDILDIKTRISNSRLFLCTPKYISESGIKTIINLITDTNPDGILVSNRGLLRNLKDQKGFKKDQIHLDYTLNTFNDIDIAAYGETAIPVISPELSLEEIDALKNKNIITMIHGDIVLMTTKEPMKAPELIDDENRHFRIRKRDNATEILNSSQLGLFNKAILLKEAGIRYFMIDTEKEPAKFARIYRKILSGDPFDDKKIRKGYTTGHLDRPIE